MSRDQIEVREAAENNLKDVDVEIPRETAADLGGDLCERPLAFALGGVVPRVPVDSSEIGQCEPAFLRRRGIAAFWHGPWSVSSDSENFPLLP